MLDNYLGLFYTYIICLGDPYSGGLPHIIITDNLCHYTNTFKQEVHESIAAMNILNSVVVSSKGTCPPFSHVLSYQNNISTIV